MKESCLAEWELCGLDYLAFLEGQFMMNRRLVNSPANHGLFFADSDSMVTKMYAEYYSKDPTCKISEEEYQKVAIMADEITRKCRWDKIYVLCPHGVFVDDHERYMAHAGMDERHALFEILCKNLKESGNWDKVTILNGGYWKNFETIVNETKEYIENGKMD
jgi:nicotinamide riboside kinase